MRIRRILVTVVVLGLAGHMAFAADPAHISVSPDILLQFEGSDLPPMEELAASGLLPSRPSGIKSEVSEMGYVTQWLSHYYMLIGSFDGDMVGETDVTPICYSAKLTEETAAPNMYRYTWYNPEIWTYYYSAYNDTAACERVYTDQVRYFFTQVKSPQAQDARLLVGADEDIKVWLNGMEVMRHQNGDFEKDQYQAQVQLKQGWNLVLVKVYYPLIGPSDHPDYEPKAWSLRFTDSSGSTPFHLTQSLDGWCDHDESYMWLHAGGVADLPGALGSQWASDLRLTNPYPYPLELTVQYFREGKVGPAGAKAERPVSHEASPAVEKALVLDPFETRTYRRVLTSLLEVTPPQKGMLAIRGYYYYDVQYNGAAELRTYNQSGDGTFGTVIPITYTYAGSTCCTQTLYGLRNGPDSRTNIGMAPRRVFDAEVTFTVTIWDPVTGAFAQKDFVGRGNFQLNNIFSRLGLGELETDTAMAYIQWNNGGTDARIRFSASVVDNYTSDPVDVSPGLWMLPPPMQ